MNLMVSKNFIPKPKFSGDARNLIDFTKSRKLN